MASSEPQSELENTAVGEQSSSLSTTFDTTSSSRLNSTRLELERRQLLHTIQLLKLELSQKQLVMDSLKTEQASRVEELQEQLSDADCEKKLLEHRLRALTQVHEVSSNSYAPIDACHCAVWSPASFCPGGGETPPAADG